MKTILIDTENINKKEEYEYIANLKNCKLIFFETKNTKNNKIPLSTAVKLSQAKVKIEFLHVDVQGKNGLDFKICTLAGKRNKWNNEVYILSKDKGYDNLKEFNIHRIESLTSLKCHSINKSELAIRKIKALVNFRKENTIQRKVRLAISDVCNKYENDVDFINNIINGINSNDKTFINNVIQKKFRSSDPVTERRLYRALASISL